MKLLTVKMHDRSGDDEDFVELDVDDVDYINIWYRTKSSTGVPAFHTFYGSFICLCNLTDLSKALKSFGFESADQSTIINTKRVKEVKSVDNNGSVIKFTSGLKVRIRKQI
jgi:DNA-binding LytR/AlgR family response regulator